MAASNVDCLNIQVSNSAKSQSQFIITNYISGAVPGLLDPSQPSRILRHPTHKLSFASFDLVSTITSSDISDLLKLSINKDLCSSKRMVIETTASGESFWSFVPNAKLEEGCVDEGIWPRVVDICGQPIECSLDQWDIYKLDPAYECFVRLPPNKSAISWALVAAQSPPPLPPPKDATKPTVKRFGIFQPAFSANNRQYQLDTEYPGIFRSATSAPGDSQPNGRDMTADEVDYMIANDALPPHPPFHNHTQSAAPSYPQPFMKVGQGKPSPALIHNSRYHLPQDGVYLCVACLYLISCVVVIGWMVVSGPKLVPRQDTRITNIIISVASKVALGLALWIVTLRLRAQWACVLNSGQRVKLRGLLAACGAGGSFARIRHIRTVPTVGIGCTALLGVAVTLLMTFTSAGFKYVVLPGTALQAFPGPDFQAICNYSLVNSTTGYFCSGSANSKTINTEWSYLDIVNSGAGGNVLLTGGHTGTMSANVTLTTAPADLRLPTNAVPPWAAVDVSCKPAQLQLVLVGNGSTSSNIVYVDGRKLDQLSIAEMPSWASQVQLYQQVNDTGPYSSLSPWYMVLLARDLDDGTANIGGLSGQAVSFLGNSFVDLHGYGPMLQGILGAAAYCNFSGSTGGSWPSETWPEKSTTNVIVGTGPHNGTLDLSTVFLNYGPSWQYSPVSANSLPGGSVTYIANLTTDANNFADYIAMYMRNQWALMMYTNSYIGGFIANTSYHVKTKPQLYIEATLIVLMPVIALAMCICCAGACMWTILGLDFWYEYVDVAPWWLLKATGAGMEWHNANKFEFETWSNQVQCMYSVATANSNPGCLTLEPRTTQGE